jgi:hypothetical protein
MNLTVQPDVLPSSSHNWHARNIGERKLQTRYRTNACIFRRNSAPNSLYVLPVEIDDARRVLPQNLDSRRPVCNKILDGRQFEQGQALVVDGWHDSSPGQLVVVGVVARPEVRFHRSHNNLTPQLGIESSGFRTCGYPVNNAAFRTTFPFASVAGQTSRSQATDEPAARPHPPIPRAAGSTVSVHLNNHCCVPHAV